MAKYYEPDELDYYGAGEWGAGVGSGLATGAAAGSTFGPWGTLIGGVVGAGVGAFGTYSDQQKYLEAQRQQQELEKELRSRSVYDLMLQQQGLSDARTRQEATVNARQAAARGNLSPQATAMLEQQAMNDLAFAQSAAKPELFLAAQAADRARQQQVLQNYGVAQGLASTATAGIGGWQQGLGAAAQGVALVGQMQQANAAAAGAEAAGGAVTTPVVAPTPSMTTPEEAAAYWRLDASVPAQGAVAPVAAPVQPTAGGSPGQPTSTALPAALAALPAGVDLGAMYVPAATPPVATGQPAAPGGLRAGPAAAPDAVPPGLPALPAPLSSTVQAAAAGDTEALLDLPFEYDFFVQAYGGGGPPTPDGVDPGQWSAFTTEMGQHGVTPENMTKEFFVRWQKFRSANAGQPPAPTPVAGGV